MKRSFTVKIITALTVGVVSVFGAFPASAESSSSSENQGRYILTGEEIKGDPLTMEELDQAAMERGLMGDYRILSNPSNDFYYYDQLDSNNQAVYDVMKEKLMTPYTSTISYELPESFSFTANSPYRSLWNTSTMLNYENALFVATKGGVNAFLFDHPEVFWFDANEVTFEPVYTRSRDMWTGRYIITVVILQMRVPINKVYGNSEYAEECIEYLQDSIDNYVIEGDDRYTKLRSMYESIANTVTYNIEAPYHDTALGMFLEPYQIVCEGYSEAIKLLCDREGIPCISVVGNYDESTRIAHMWNYVKMEDGKWYGLDCTWDDRDGQTPSVTFNFFLKGSKSFLKDHDLNFGVANQRIIFPELSEDDYVYQEPNTEPSTIATEPTETTLTSVSETTVTTVTTVSTSETASVSSTEISTEPTEITTETTPYIPEQLKGDFNNDGELTIADAVLLQKKLLGKVNLTQHDFLSELNGDKKINIIDYILLMNIIKQ